MIFSKKKWIVFLLMLFCSIAFAQKEKCHKYIPRPFTKNPQRLSYLLTKGLTNDSDKVCVIHDWITHNIKYDVKKWIKYDYRRIPVKKILKKRKAICVGYSDLFVELCKHAGINAVAVSGYTKNRMVDQNDKMYLSDHMWNAVYINGNWKLVDATWDAGYIKFYKRTILGYVVFAFTLGYYDHYKFKPHFKKAPHKAYFNRSGEFFKVDHLPDISLWQLTDEPLTVNDFQADSAFYYGKYDRLENDPVSGQGYLDANRMEYYNRDSVSKEIINGIDAYQFNFRNHYDIGNSYLLMANEISKSIEPKLSDTSSVRISCDTVFSNLKKAVIHYDSNAYYLPIQKMELDANNKKKKEILIEQNTRLIKSTKLAMSNLRRGKSLARTIKQPMKRINKRNEKKMEALFESESFYKAKPPKKSNPKDSLAQTLIIEENKVKIQQINRDIVVKYKRLDSLYTQLVKDFNYYAQWSAVNTANTAGASKLRLKFYDDLDYLIRSIKDTILEHKFYHDSMLYSANKQLYAKQYFDLYKSLKNDFELLNKSHTVVARAYIKMKTSCVLGAELKELYTGNLQDLQREINEYRGPLFKTGEQFLAMKSTYRRQVRMTRKEYKWYVGEKSIELSMFRVRKMLINSRVKSLINANNEMKKQAAGISSKILIVKKKLKKAK